MKYYLSIKKLKTFCELIQSEFQNTLSNEKNVRCGVLQMIWIVSPKVLCWNSGPDTCVFGLILKYGLCSCNQVKITMG
jgi:hypothetical protein